MSGNQVFTNAMSPVFTPVVQFAQFNIPGIAKTEQEILYGQQKDVLKDFLLYKLHAREYQKDWVCSGVLRDDHQQEMAVIGAIVSSGKTTTKGLYLKSLDRIGYDTTFTVILIASNTQNVIAKLHNDVISGLPSGCGIIYSEFFAKRVKPHINAGEFIYSSHSQQNDFSAWAKNKKHIICFGSHKYFRDYVKPLLTNKNHILKNRKCVALIDESHAELHTDGTDGHEILVEPNTGNGRTMYSELGIATIDGLINLKFVVTAFSGTPSVQQQGKTNFNGKFVYYDLVPEALKEIQYNGTFLEEVVKIRVANLTIKEVWAKSHLKKTVQNIQKYVFDRPGLGIMYLKTFGETHIDEYDAARAENELHPCFPKDSFLYWFGDEYEESRISAENSGKYCYVKKRDNKGKVVYDNKGEIVYEKKNFDVSDNPNDVLANHPEIKLILVKNLLSEGFDHPNVNTIIFGKPINKEVAFLGEQQRCGRGTRKGEVGLIIIFTAQQKNSNHKLIGFDNCDNLIKLMLTDGTLLTKEKYDKLRAEFKPQRKTLLSVDEAKYISEQLLENKNFFLRQLNIDVQYRINKAEAHYLEITKKHANYAGEQKIDRQKMSTAFSELLEDQLNLATNMTKTAGQNEEDGFVYIPSTDRYIAVDVKSNIFKIRDTPFADDYDGSNVYIKDTKTGDTKLNTHIVPVVVRTTIEKGTISEIIVDIVDLSEESVTEKDHNINYERLKKLSIYSTTITA